MVFDDCTTISKVSKWNQKVEDKAKEFAFSTDLSGFKPCFD